MNFHEAIDALLEAAENAVIAAENEDGAPADALRGVLLDIESIADTGLTRKEYADALALYKGAKQAGLV